MNRSLLLFAALCACGTPSPMPSVSGEMALTSSSTALTQPVRLAVVWFPSSGATPGTTPKSVVTSPVQYTGNFPQSFTFELAAEPPQEAQAVSGGQSTAAGALVA